MTCDPASFTDRLFSGVRTVYSPHCAGVLELASTNRDQSGASKEGIAREHKEDTMISGRFLFVFVENLPADCFKADIGCARSIRPERGESMMLMSTDEEFKQSKM